ncbi:MAG: flagellar biosynthesis protein FlgD [Sphingomonadaceae bacterium]|jgi:flagellar basal-body rod modification protein FlgD|nr:flagellar biosynthesis protein FlgD [Sphingomonadaceae bacterium]
MVDAVTASGSKPLSAPPKMPALGQADFIRLLTTQLKQQDPTDPVDNKEMIAQMAQFSSLSGIDQINSTLKDIATRLDQVIAAQGALNAAPTVTQE